MYHCRDRNTILAMVNRPSRIKHPKPGVIVVFADHVACTTTFRCPKRAETMIHRDGRISIEDDRRTARVVS